MTANDEVVTVQDSISASSDTAESEGAADQAVLNKVLKINRKNSSNKKEYITVKYEVGR